MVQDEFTRLLNEHGGSIDNRKAFCGLVKDFFPANALQANLIIALYDMRIHEDLRTVPYIGNTFAFRFVKKLMDEFGTSRKNADWAVSLWCVSYGQNTLKKPCEIKVADDNAVYQPSIRSETQKSANYTDLFKYLPKDNGNGFTVAGFNGANNQTIIFQNRYRNKPVEEISESAFSETDVQEIILSEGYIRIGNKAFQGCGNLKQAIIPFSVKEIADYAFSGCTKLSTFSLPINLQQIGKYAFAETALKQIVFPATLYWIDEGAFSNCTRLTEIFIPKTIARIPSKCFAGCTGLTRVSLEEGIEHIGAEAFRECIGLYEISIPDSVVSIGENAFAELNPKFIVQCSSGSYAETYARERRLKYQLV